MNDLDDEDDRRRAALIKRARTEGIEAAFESALEIVRNPKAPSQARTAAQRTLMQIGGVMDYRDRERMDEKDLADMDGNELGKLVKRLERKQRTLAAGEGAGSVFD